MAEAAEAEFVVLTDVRFAFFRFFGKNRQDGADVKKNWRTRCWTKSALETGFEGQNQASSLELGAES